MRTYAVGDIHGRLDLLEMAIEKIELASPEGGRFIVLGDFIDRGPDSRGVIERLMEGPRSPVWDWIVLQGNHEAMMLECLIRPNVYKWWLENGGYHTLVSYGYEVGENVCGLLKIPDEHLRWINKLPIAFEDQRRIFVHAGVPFDKHIDDTSKETIQWMLYRDHDADEEELHKSAEYHLDAGLHISGKHIVHGHDQSPNNPLLKRQRTNLDSYAWATGHLAIGVFDNKQPGPKQIWSVVGSGTVDW